MWNFSRLVSAHVILVRSLEAENDDIQDLFLLRGHGVYIERFIDSFFSFFFNLLPLSFLGNLKKFSLFFSVYNLEM